jgi:hypothetical protein
MTEEQNQSFKNILAEFAKSRKLDAADRDHLSRWSDDDRANGVWSKISDGIRKAQGIEPNDCDAYFFIQEVLSLRGFVRNPNIRPAFLERARDAERLARFLTGPVDHSLPPAMLSFPNYEGLAQSLNELSKMLREQAARFDKVGLVRSSRKTNSLPRMNFSRLASDLLESLCGQPLDNEVATLTQIAFGKKRPDADLVRNARRPPAKRGKATLT